MQTYETLKSSLFTTLDTEHKLFWFHYLDWMQSLHETEGVLADEGTSEWARHRNERQQLISKANAFYSSYYAMIKEELLSWLSESEKALLAEEPNSETNEVGSHNTQYLSRDWTKNPDYDQVALIVNRITERLTELGIRTASRAFFPGCGSGRYAVELGERYDEVFACDYSFPMIWSILHLHEKRTWEIFHKNARNCRRVADTLESHQLEMTEQQADLIERKIRFFVADALKNGLENHTVDHLYSIYFTDVLPLRIWFQEVDRLLAENGLYIHFGPLEYFFSNENEMYTAEEVRMSFQAHGYTILADEFMETRHLYNAGSMVHRVYDNWLFIAQKPLRKLITSDVQIQLHEDAEMNSTKEQYTLVFHDRDFTLPSVIFDLLQVFRVPQTLGDALRLLELENLDKESEIQLLAILQELADSNILIISSYETI
ncbi:N2227-like protein [compost metagenome]